MSQTQEDPGITAKSRFRQRLVGWVAALSLPVIALGNFSEAVMIVEDTVDRVISSFTHIPEYQDLAYLRSGISLEYARDVFGNPQVHRQLSDNLSAEYYFDTKYLLTMLVSGREVRGFTVISLMDGFAPDVFGERGGPLGEFRFAEIKGLPALFVVDWTKATALYLETINLGGESLTHQPYVGWVNYGAGTEGEGLADLYRSLLMEDDNEALRNVVRGTFVPNLYGWGTVSLQDIRKSILSPSELGHYLTAYQQ